MKNGTIINTGEVKDVINDYISSKEKKRNIYRHQHDDTKPINIRLVFIKHLEKEGVGEIKFDDDFEIVIDYEINSPIHSGAVSVAIITSDDVILMASAEFDKNEIILGSRKPGMFRSAVTIPGKMLNAGHYTVRVFSANVLKSKAYDRVDAISFTIIGSGAHLGVGARAAHLVPILNWHTLEL
jgi:hypothetical protein